MRFRETIQLNGKTATGIPVPTELLKSLGPSKKPAVGVTIKGYTYRSSVGSVGGVYTLPVSSETRASAGVAD